MRLTLATLLYSGKSPDGHHILVSSCLLRKPSDLCTPTSPTPALTYLPLLCVCVISEQCQVPTQGVAGANCPSHQGLPQFALHHRLQPHHSASGKNAISRHTRLCLWLRLKASHEAGTSQAPAQEDGGLNGEQKEGKFSRAALSNYCHSHCSRWEGLCVAQEARTPAPCVKAPLGKISNARVCRLEVACGNRRA